MTREVSAVSILVQDLEEQAACPDFVLNQQDPHKQAKLRSVIDGIIYALRELEGLANKYSSLSTAKKNNWDRLRFATKSIDDVRARLILHTSAAQTILDGLANRGIARIESKTDETNGALTRIEQVLADIVKDLKHGTKDSSIVSDEKWNIWTELKRELRLEGYPVEVVQQHREQIKRYMLDLLQDAGIRDEVQLDELDPSNINGDDNETQSCSKTQVQEGILFPRSDDAVSRNFWLSMMVISVAGLLASILSYIYPRLVASMPPNMSLQFSSDTVWQPYRFWYNRSSFEFSINPTASTPSEENKFLPASKSGEVMLELKAGLFKNDHSVRFSCDDGSQAHVWIEQMSPLFDTNLLDEQAVKIQAVHPAAHDGASRLLQADTATSPAEGSIDAMQCPRYPPQLGGYYWNIYSKETPCGHDHSD